MGLGFPVSERGMVRSSALSVRMMAASPKCFVVTAELVQGNSPTHEWDGCILMLSGEFWLYYSVVPGDSMHSGGWSLSDVDGAVQSCQRFEDAVEAFDGCGFGS